MSWNDDIIEKFRASSGADNDWGTKLIVMHTRGARTEQVRLAPVVGFKDATGWTVVASKGGADENPAWYFNLKAHPAVEIETVIDGKIEILPVFATEISGVERDVEWERIVDEAPSFAEYPKMTQRSLPLVHLTTAPRVEVPVGA